MERNKRRKIFTIVPDSSKKRIQLKYVALIISTQIVCILVLVIGYNSILHLVLQSAQLGRYAEMQLSKVFFWMNWLFAGVTIISIIIGGILSLHLSHKFVGPLYRIENTIKSALKDGKLVEFKIREDDELHELIILLNELMKKGIKYG
jgi:hypothetical protein